MRVKLEVTPPRGLGSDRVACHIVVVLESTAKSSSDALVPFATFFIVSVLGGPVLAEFASNDSPRSYSRAFIDIYRTWLD